MNVRSIFGGSRAFGCGALSRRQVDLFLEGGLDEESWDRFRSHGQTCHECRHLAEALDIFRELLENGVLDAERAAFERSERTLRARLRQELERLPPGKRRLLARTADLSCEQLEQIAAAGPEEVAAGDLAERDEKDDDTSADPSR